MNKLSNIKANSSYIGLLRSWTPTIGSIVAFCLRLCVKIFLNLVNTSGIHPIHTNGIRRVTI